jgi:peptide-methionine (S)-S-oxide reductase
MRAIFAAGCFWHVQLDFSEIPGVINTRAGYAGGHIENPSYEQVSSGKTGHAESVEVEFKPEKVTYDSLLEKFWEMHDPTTLNQQGSDIGLQYRSIIFYDNEEQRKRAEKSKRNQERKLGKKIVTEVVKISKFWPAEEHHQNYLKKNNLKICPIK